MTGYDYFLNYFILRSGLTGACDYQYCAQSCATLSGTERVHELISLQVVVHGQ
jgi:hypothetical protein